MSRIYCTEQLSWVPQNPPSSHSQALSTALAGHSSLILQSAAPSCAQLLEEPEPSCCQCACFLSDMVLGGATGQHLKVMFRICTVHLLNATVTKSCLSSCIATALPPCPLHPASLSFPSTPCSLVPTVGYIWRPDHFPHHHILFSKICSSFGRSEPYHPPSSGCQKNRGFGVKHVPHEQCPSFSHPGRNMK